MMNQETYVKMNDLRLQGWTMAEIAAETGFHPATISAHLKAGGPPTRRAVPDSALVLNARWLERLDGLIRTYPRLLGVSVHNKLRAEGFDGGYSTITRALRDIRGPRFSPADRVSVPIHTDPGEEAQFDFCDLSDWSTRWGWTAPLWCFGMILSWSRWRMWWFTTSQDRQHTFEGMARFFDAVGGVPVACRTDRMGALGRSQGQRFVLHAPSVGFAAHHATTITSCKARDAKRKGKVERPFRQLREAFMSEVELDGIPDSLGELNRRAEHWLNVRVHGVASRSTGELPSARLVVERPFLTTLPRMRFDTDYVETRRVHNIVPFVSVDGVRYSVPPNVLGQLVEVRRHVDADTMEIRHAGRMIRTHQVGAGDEHGVVWDPVDRHQAETIAMRDKTVNGDEQRADYLCTEHRHLRLVPPAEQLEFGDGDFDVPAPDLDARYGIDGELA